MQTQKEYKSLETPKEHVDDLLKEKLERVFHKQTAKVRLHELVKIASEHTPVDLAYAASRLPSNMRPILYENLPDRDAKNDFIVNTDSDTRLVLFQYIKDLELKRIFERMPSDEAAWVVEDMPERRYRKVLELIDHEKAGKIRELTLHDRKSAGRLMCSEFFAFEEDLSIGEAAQYIRDNPRIDFTKGVFLLNIMGELQGFVPSRNMIVNPPSTPLKQVMRPILHKVTVDDPRELVIELFERYKIESLPVVDKMDGILGVINQEDVVEAMEEASDETMGHLSGTDGKITSRDPVLQRVYTRFPWLLFTLFAGLVNVLIMSSFERKEGGVMTFALFFVPLITGMSGNIGLQCSAILIRLMAMGGFSPGSRRETVIKELMTGLLTGSVFGVGCGLIILLFSGLAANQWGFFNPLAIASIIGLGLIGSCATGTLLGVFSPILFGRMGIDPAISAGPIVTAFNDFLSMTIYFLIAWGVGTLFF